MLIERRDVIEEHPIVVADVANVRLQHDQSSAFAQDSLRFAKRREDFGALEMLEEIRHENNVRGLRGNHRNLARTRDDRFNICRGKARDIFIEIDRDLSRTTNVVDELARSRGELDDDITRANVTLKKISAEHAPQRVAVIRVPFESIAIQSRKLQDVTDCTGASNLIK